VPVASGANSTMPVRFEFKLVRLASASGLTEAQPEHRDTAAGGGGGTDSESPGAARLAVAHGSALTPTQALGGVGGSCASGTIHVRVNAGTLAPASPSVRAGPLKAQ
jgi:hypothetical protein